MPRMTIRKTLKLKTTLADLSVLDEALTEVADADDWPEKITTQLRLVLEELVVNIIHYGHEDEEGDVLHDIEVVLVADAQMVAVEIIDDGKPFDPLQDAHVPDVDLDIEDRPIGGLGIHLVQKLTDKVEYSREQNLNKLRIEKYKNA